MGVAKLTDQNTVFPESSYARLERERRYLLRDPLTNKWIVKFTQKFAVNSSDLSRTLITNTYLNAQEAEILSVFEANEIRKNRYRFEFEGRKFGIDMFLGDLFGLVLAEVSFDDDEELESFPKPPFALVEV